MHDSERYQTRRFRWAGADSAGDRIGDERFFVVSRNSTQKNWHFTIRSLSDIPYSIRRQPTRYRRGNANAWWTHSPLLEQYMTSTSLPLQDRQAERFAALMRGPKVLKNPKSTRPLEHMWCATCALNGLIVAGTAGLDTHMIATS